MNSNNKGFTLTETLLTIVLVLLFTSAVVIGIRVINRTMKNIQNKANAQVLLSTTLTLMSDELKYATDTTTQQTTTLIKVNTEQNDSEIWISFTNDEKNGIQKSYLTEQLIDNDVKFQSSGVTVPLVTTKAQTDELHTSFASITYENQTFTIKDLTVRDKNNKVIEKIDTFKIIPLNIKEK